MTAHRAESRNSATKIFLFILAKRHGSPEKQTQRTDKQCSFGRKIIRKSYNQTPGKTIPRLLLQTLLSLKKKMDSVLCLCVRAFSLLLFFSNCVTGTIQCTLWFHVMYFLIFLAPGAYSPEKSSITTRRTPSYSFGLRTIHEKPSQTPGKCFSCVSNVL